MLVSYCDGNKTRSRPGWESPALKAVRVAAGKHGSLQLVVLKVYVPRELRSEQDLTKG